MEGEGAEGGHYRADPPSIVGGEGGSFTQQAPAAAGGDGPSTFAAGGQWMDRATSAAAEYSKAKLAEDSAKVMLQNSKSELQEAITVLEEARGHAVIMRSSQPPGMPGSVDAYSQGVVQMYTTPAQHLAAVEAEFAVNIAEANAQQKTAQTDSQAAHLTKTTAVVEQAGSRLAEATIDIMTDAAAAGSSKGTIPQERSEMVLTEVRQKVSNDINYAANVQDHLTAVQYNREIHACKALAVNQKLEEVHSELQRMKIDARDPSVDISPSVQLEAVAEVTALKAEEAQRRFNIAASNLEQVRVAKSQAATGLQQALHAFETAREIKNMAQHDIDGGGAGVGRSGATGTDLAIARAGVYMASGKLVQARNQEELTNLTERAAEKKLIEADAVRSAIGEIQKDVEGWVNAAQSDRQAETGLNMLSEVTARKVQEASISATVAVSEAKKAQAMSSDLNLAAAATLSQQPMPRDDVANLAVEASMIAPLASNLAVAPPQEGQPLPFHNVSAAPAVLPVVTAPYEIPPFPGKVLQQVASPMHMMPPPGGGGALDPPGTIFPGKVLGDVIGLPPDSGGMSAPPPVAVGGIDDAGMASLSQVLEVGGGAAAAAGDGLYVEGEGATARFKGSDISQTFGEEASSTDAPGQQRKVADAGAASKPPAPARRRGAGVGGRRQVSPPGVRGGGASTSSGKQGSGGSGSYDDPSDDDDEVMGAGGKATRTPRQKAAAGGRGGASGGSRHDYRSSRFCGVSFKRQTGKWQAKISIDSRQIHIGVFDSEVEAAEAYDRIAISAKGAQESRSVLNFPLDHYSKEVADLEATPLEMAVAKVHREGRRGKRRKTSRYRGVSYHKARSKWQANLCLNAKQRFLGIHATQEDAARAYDMCALLFKSDGEDVATNFPAELYEADLQNVAHMSLEEVLKYVRNDGRAVANAAAATAQVSAPDE